MFMKYVVIAGIATFGISFADTPVKRQCSSYHFNCCGGQFYHPPGQVCCSMGWGRTPEIRSGPYGGDTACCGNTTFNARVHTCCNGVPRALDGVRYKV